MSFDSKLEQETEGTEPPSGVGAWLGQVLLYLRQVLTSNLYLKALAFALAAVLWAMVAGDQNAEDTVEVFLDIKRPEKLILLNPPPQRITVGVIGPLSKLKTLRSRKLELTVDLRNAQPPELLFHFAGQRISNLPSGLDIVTYNPAYLKLMLDERMTRTLPVRARIEGRPARGYAVSEVTVTPAMVTIVGPKEELKNWQKVKTEPIRITDLRETISNDFRLEFSSPHVRVEEQRESVGVIVVIEPTFETRAFEKVPIEIPETMGKCKITPDVAKISLNGPKEEIRSIDSNDVRLIVQEATGRRGENKLGPFTLRYPPAGKETGHPHLKLNWPDAGEVEFKRLSPRRFKLRCSAEGEGAKTETAMDTAGDPKSNE